MAKITSNLPASRYYDVPQKGDAENDYVWRFGSFGKYRYEAVLGDKASGCGIAGGSVMKIKIFRVEAPGLRKGRETEIVNYDCGWNTKPKTRTEHKVLKATLECLEYNEI